MSDKKLKNGKILLLSVTTIIALVLNIGVFFIVCNTTLKNEIPEKTVEEEIMQVHGYHNIEIKTNLKTRPGYKKIYVKIGFSLQYEGEINGEQITKKEHMIRDSIINTLNNKDHNDLLDKEKLKELKKEIKEDIVEKTQVNIIEVFIHDLVVQ